MGTTDNYELPYAELTDPPNSPLQSKALAEAVDAALLAVHTELTVEPSAMAYAGASATIPDDTRRLVDLSVVAWDWADESMREPSSQSRLYARRTGRYRLSVKATFNSDNDGYRYLDVMKNSNADATLATGTGLDHDRRTSFGGLSSPLRTDREVYLVAGEYVQFFVMHSAGNSLALLAGENNTHMSLTWIGA